MVRLTKQWEKDAEEFGRFVRGGSWAIGLLVARNVGNTGKGGGSAGKFPKGAMTASRVGVRVSIVAFAETAACSQATVRRYLATWENAAAAGLVPPAAELTPGDELEFNDATHTPQEWSSHYPRGHQATAPGLVKGLEGKKLTEHVGSLIADPEVRRELVKQVAEDQELVEEVHEVRMTARLNEVREPHERREPLTAGQRAERSAAVARSQTDAKAAKKADHEAVGLGFIGLKLAGVADRIVEVEDELSKARGSAHGENRDALLEVLASIDQHSANIRTLLTPVNEDELQNWMSK